MAHRDDRDALRARIDAQARDLAEAESRIESLAEERDRARAEVERLERALDDAKRRPARPVGGRGAAPGAAAAASIALATVAGVAVAFVALSPRDAEVVAVAPAPVAVQAVAPAPPPAPPLSARWAASVTRASTGAPVAAGASCGVEATFRGGSQRAEIDRVVVRCGATELYDSAAQPGFGMSMVEGSVTAWAGPTATTDVYELEHSDVGQRSGGRPYAQLRSWTGPSRVWRDDAQGFDVALELAPTSDPVEPPGGPVAPRAAFTGVVHRSATLRDAQGYDDVVAGARCLVAVRPHGIGPYECRVIVRCGAAVLYGSGTSGMNHCAATPGRVSDTGTSPIDGDPTLELDLAAGTVTISDELGEVRRRAELTLDPGAP